MDETDYEKKFNDSCYFDAENESFETPVGLSSNTFYLDCSKISLDADMGNTLSDDSKNEDLNSSTEESKKETTLSSIGTAGGDASIELVKDSSFAKDESSSVVVVNDSIISVQDDSVKMGVEMSLKEVERICEGLADSPRNNIVPTTPPATPTNSGDPPQFPTPNLDSTFLLSDKDVSNPSVPENSTTQPENAEKPVKNTAESIVNATKPIVTTASDNTAVVGTAESVNAAVESKTESVNAAVDRITEAVNSVNISTPDTIAAPILEAAAIANAVAGISISNPSTPVNVSTPGGEPAFDVKTEGKESTAPVEANDGKKCARDEEMEFMRTRVKTLEAELVAALAKPGSKNHALVETIKQQHEELLSKARGMLFDKTKIVKNQELQIEALNSQVASLKDVNSITKDLLEIRNSEIKHLEERLNNMEARFKAEKERHLLILKRAETGQNINNDLKAEYEGQLKIFKDLREMYEQRVQALVNENHRLKECLEATKAAKSANPST